MFWIISLPNEWCIYFVCGSFGPLTRLLIKGSCSYDKETNLPVIKKKCKCYVVKYVFTLCFATDVWRRGAPSCTRGSGASCCSGGQCQGRAGLSGSGSFSHTSLSFSTNMSPIKHVWDILGQRVHQCVFCMMNTPQPVKPAPAWTWIRQLKEGFSFPLSPKVC